jgi:hypothetical protein
MTQEPLIWLCVKEEEYNVSPLAAAASVVADVRRLGEPKHHERTEIR